MKDDIKVQKQFGRYLETDYIYLYGAEGYTENFNEHTQDWACLHYKVPQIF